jgi:hypothetical protein
MAGRTGTHDISFLLAATNPITNGTISFDDIVRTLDADVAAYNTIMRDSLDALVTPRNGTADRIGAYGGSASGSMTEVDEHGRAPTQRAAAVAQVGFPLKKYQYNVGWTKEWEKRRSPADFARSVQGAQAGHHQRVSAELKKALFLSANFTLRDHLVDNVDIAVKRLVNADGAVIPNGPNGETFDGATHTHYLANATLTTTAVDSAISTVVEHGHGSSLRIYISQTNETAFRALTGFVAYVDPRLMLGTQTNQPATRLDISRLNNRAIGIYGAAEVWVKPWAIANYAIVFDAGSPQKTLGMREDPAGSMDLVRAAEFEDHPLRVDFYESYFGFGVLTRTNGAILYFAGASYTDPTISNP